MNKRKRVAIEKHRRKRQKERAKRRATKAVPAGRGASSS